MVKSFLISLVTIFAGIAVGYIFFYRNPFYSLPHPFSNKVIGFLPYWLAQRAQKDYAGYLTEISYFSLSVNDDGHIKKLSSSQEEEPGWRALNSGKMNLFLEKARKNNQSLALTVFSGNNDSIGALIKDPVVNADNLAKDTVPIMKKYGFSELNFDIEYVGVASEAARVNFTRFVKEVRKNLNKTIALSIDISPSAFIKNYLVAPGSISKFVDFVVIMGYDYHYPGSEVTGPVAPLFGAGITAEFDIQTAVKKALSIIPPGKIILGVPLYGYEWETLDGSPRSPIIPGTGLVASSSRVKKLLDVCATCSAKFDPVAQEKYIIYKDMNTNSYHQFFYPDEETMAAKVKFAQKYNLGGIALWALGYEDSTVLRPLKNY